MSSSVGYGYSYVDEVAAERRRLREEIARLGAQAGTLRAQAASHSSAAAKSLGLDRFSGRAGSSDNAVLAALASDMRQAIAASQATVDELAADAWTTRRSRRGSSPGRSVSATEELARTATAGGRPLADGAVPGAVPQQVSTGQAVARAVADAEALLRAEAPRCGAADLDQLDRRLTELRASDRPDAARRMFADLEHAVRESIARRKADERAAIVRAGLLARAADALPQDRDRLVAAIIDAPDPDSLAAMVDDAVARADTARQRAAVSVAAAQALRDIGCEVGEDFVTILSGRGEGAVRLGPDWPDGYGVFVRLPDDSAQLLAAVVRHPDADADLDTDRAAQQEFCDRGLDRFEDGIGRSGVRLHRVARMAPGQAPVGTVPAAKWAEPADAVSRRAKRGTSRAATPDAARERQHEH